MIGAAASSIKKVHLFAPSIQSDTLTGPLTCLRRALPDLCYMDLCDLIICDVMWCACVHHATVMPFPLCACGSLCACACDSLCACACDSLCACACDSLCAYVRVIPLCVCACIHLYVTVWFALCACVSLRSCVMSAFGVSQCCLFMSSNLKQPLHHPRPSSPQHWFHRR
jgi:hypothetical protein